MPCTTQRSFQYVLQFWAICHLRSFLSTTSLSRAVVFWYDNTFSFPCRVAMIASTSVCSRTWYTESKSSDNVNRVEVAATKNFSCGYRCGYGFNALYRLRMLWHPWQPLATISVIGNFILFLYFLLPGLVLNMGNWGGRTGSRAIAKRAFSTPPWLSGW